MFAIIPLLARLIADLFKSRRRLEVEKFFLRHQLSVAGVRAVSSQHVSSGGLPCASGEELVSLGFRVGNPSAIGWYQRANFPASARKPQTWPV